jgi:hypothetical protein
VRQNNKPSIRFQEIAPADSCLAEALGIHSYVEQYMGALAANDHIY